MLASCKRFVPSGAVSLVVMGPLWVFTSPRVVCANPGSVLGPFPRRLGPCGSRFRTLPMSSPPSHTLRPGRTGLHQVVHASPHSPYMATRILIHPRRTVTRSWKWALRPFPGTPSTAQLHRQGIGTGSTPVSGTRPGSWRATPGRPEGHPQAVQMERVGFWESCWMAGTRRASLGRQHLGGTLPGQGSH